MLNSYRGMARTLLNRIVCAHRRQVALRELAALNDRILNDIGLSRASIPHVIDRALTQIGGTGMTLIRVTRDTSLKDCATAVARKEETFRRAA